MFLKLAYQNMFSIVSQNTKTNSFFASHAKKCVFDVTGEKDVVMGKGALRARGGARSAILVSCFSHTAPPRPSDTFLPASVCLCNAHQPLCANVCLCNAHHCVQMLGIHQSCLMSNTTRNFPPMRFVPDFNFLEWDPK